MLQTGYKLDYCPSELTSGVCFQAYLRGESCDFACFAEGLKGKREIIGSLQFGGLMDVNSGKPFISENLGLIR